MKKLLAVLLSLVMMFSVVTLPASASAETAGEISVESIENTLEDALDVFEAIFNLVHKIVHGFSEIFDFDCPFCDDKADVEEPTDPGEPEEPVAPSVMYVYNEEELKAALEKGGLCVANGDFNVDSFEVSADAKVNFALEDGSTISGKTVTNDGDLTVSGGTISSTEVSIVNNGNLVVSGATVNSAKAVINNGTAMFTDVTVNAGSAVDYASISNADSVTTYNNVDIKSAGGGIGVVNGGMLVFESGSVDVSSASTSGRYNFYVVGEGTEVTINGGMFSFSETLNQKRAYIYVGAGAVVTVNGGTFGPASTRSGYTDGILGDGQVIIKGGTFGFDPSKWVAEGYTATQSNGVWTVAAN